MNGQFDELRGLAKGIICDGDVNPREANGLRQWLVSNSEAIDDPSCQSLAMLLIEILKDGQFDAAERSELKLVLRELIAALPRSSPVSGEPINIY